jgi:hypothetical protein
MGALKINESYEFINITDLGEMNYNSCANCGRAIRYVVELKDSQNLSHYVGTECSKTLQKYNISNDYSMNEQINEMKKLSKAINLVNNGSDLKFWGYGSKDYLHIIGLNKNGTPQKIYVQKLFDVFLQKEYKFINDFLNDVYTTKDVILKDWCAWDYLSYYESLKTKTDLTPI